MEVLAEKQHEENGAKLIVNGNKTVNVGEEGKHSSSGKNGVKKVRRKKRADSVKEKQSLHMSGDEEDTLTSSSSGLDSEGDSPICSETSDSAGTSPSPPSLQSSETRVTPSPQAIVRSPDTRRVSRANRFDLAENGHSSSGENKDNMFSIPSIFVRNKRDIYLSGNREPSSLEPPTASRQPRDLGRIQVDISSLKAVYSKDGSSDVIDGEELVNKFPVDMPANVNLSATLQAYELQTQPTPTSRSSEVTPRRCRRPCHVLLEHDRGSGRVRSEGDLRMTSAPTTPSGGYRRAEDVFGRVSVKSLCASFADLSLTSDRGENGTPSLVRKHSASLSLTNNGTNGQISSDHSRIHVRSYDSSKAIKKFNMSGEEQVGTCRVCSRQVFQMERVKAEGACWHRNCFRCVECNRQLSVDTYASHGGQLYCQPHHKQLFLPKAVEADQQEQASSKGDYGLEDLQHLNVRDRFAMFENGTPTTPSGGDHQKQYQAELTASGSIANKMKKFQRRCHGDGEMNGDACRLSDGDSSVCSESASEQEEDGEMGEEKVVRSNRKHYREQAGSFSGMSDAKSRFEGGMTRREMLREERKGELTRLRDMICGAREHRAAYEEALKEQNKEKEKKCLDDFPQISQESLKASYQRALQEGSLSSAVGEDSTVPVSRQLASSLAHKFESGQLDHSDGQADETRRWREEEAELFQEANTARDARSMFLQMDTQGSVQQPLSRSPSSVSTRPASLRQVDAELDSIDGQNDDEEREVLLKSHTARLMLDKFKQLETDGRQGSDVSGVNREVASGNARQVLSLFKQMEENAMREDLSDGPRPLKCMTPPADYTGDTGSEEEYTYTDEDGDPDDSEFQEEDDQFNMSHDRARSLRARFEQWEKMGEHESSFNVEDECRPSLDTAKNLRAMFESLKDQPQAVQKPQPKVSRFVAGSSSESCSSCQQPVYAMERLEINGRILHKQCFRCSKCNCALRMENYTVNAGALFCSTHFRQLFKIKGDYDQGFGQESLTAAFERSSAKCRTEDQTVEGAYEEEGNGRERDGTAVTGETCSVIPVGGVTNNFTTIRESAADECMIKPDYVKDSDSVVVSEKEDVENEDRGANVVLSENGCSVEGGSSKHTSNAQTRDLPEHVGSASGKSGESEMVVISDAAAHLDTVGKSDVVCEDRVCGDVSVESDGSKEQCFDTLIKSDVMSDGRVSEDVSVESETETHHDTPIKSDVPSEGRGSEGGEDEGRYRCRVVSKTTLFDGLLSDTSLDISLSALSGPAIAVEDAERFDDVYLSSSANN